MPDNDMQHELIRGVLTENVLPGDQHGVAVAGIAWLLGNFSGDNDYGEVSGRSVFLLERNPDTVRRPDLAWVAPGRIARPFAGYPGLTPDLVVEVRSPSDSRRHMVERAMMWLSHGVRMALVADPGPVTLAVYRPGEPPQVLADSTDLTGAMCCPASPPPSGASSGGGSRQGRARNQTDSFRVPRLCSAYRT